jgi:hypothetical protein
MAMLAGMPPRKTMILAIFALLLSLQLCAQESLGEKARRIRAARENGTGQTASAPGEAAARKPVSPAAADLSATLALISETDPEKYAGGVRLLLEQERFRALDDLAAGDRANKTRFAGGEWKLRAFYDAIASPAGKGRGVVADWNLYRDRLNRWMAQQPGSITARVALAQAELMFAWQVRGTRDADIAPERQLLFTQKLKAAETILNQASDLPEKCPEWYVVMQQVGRASGWELEGLSGLLERAVAFDPQYYYVYQQHALTLMPRWRGREGDAEKFAAEAADRMGGKPGDILYWQIAQAIMGDPDMAKAPQHFVWSRALIGYQALVEQFGSSTLRQNQIAFMAARFGDYMTTDDLLLQIGDRWDPAAWGSQEYFEKVKAWARGSAGPFKKIIEAYRAVNLNIATPEGRRYDGQIAKEFSARYSRMVEDCTVKSSGTPPTLLILQMAKSGSVQQMLVVPETASDACLRPRLEKANFSPPPKPEYWVRVSLK